MGHRTGISGLSRQVPRYLLHTTFPSRAEQIPDTTHRVVEFGLGFFSSSFFSYFPFKPLYCDFELRNVVIPGFDVAIFRLDGVLGLLGGGCRNKKFWRVGGFAGTGICSDSDSFPTITVVMSLKSRSRAGELGRTGCWESWENDATRAGHDALRSTAAGLGRNNSLGKTGADQIVKRWRCRSVVGAGSDWWGWGAIAEIGSPESCRADKPVRGDRLSG